ncbi:YggS family pyridoxal phosphate-dependent enzyme [Bartonella choladocola]|nr:YggS family pyridoxal phosphate-dependent enzyme [Bartonella choladocola]
MDAVIAQWQKVKENIVKACHDAKRAADDVQLIAVSKTFGVEDIHPLLEAGQRVFGENRVQEAESKWPQLRDEFPDLKLHLIGPLQSNKTKEAVQLFDVIETVDREKIAKFLQEEMLKQNRKLACYVQVNIGEEPQKAGIAPNEAVEFVKHCKNDHHLDIVGLMCIPPVGENPGPYFALLAKLAKEAGVEKLSMGMSADYETAIAFGATSVRVGSAIFGHRPPISHQ